MTQSPSLSNPAPEESCGILDLTMIFGDKILEDGQILGALMEPDRAHLADGILETAGGLAALAAMGPLELLALGLTETEAARIRIQAELTVRILRGHRRRRLGSLETFVADLRTRGLQWPRHTAGVTGVDADGRIVLDRALFEGSRTCTFIDYSEILREALKAGCSSIVVWRWQPEPEARVDDEDHRICEELRVRAAALKLAVIDYVVIAEGTFYAARHDQGWIDG